MYNLHKTAKLFEPYPAYSVPSLEFGTLYPLKVMNALHYIEDQCILCLLLAILIQYSGADYSSNGITEPITQPAVSQDQDQKSKTSELSSTTSSPTISQSSITPTTPVKMNSKSKTSFMEKVSQRASALNMTRLSSELVLATGSSTLRYQYLQLTYLMVKIFFFFSKKKIKRFLIYKISIFRSVRLEELKVSRVLHALTYEDVEEKGHATPTLEGVVTHTIVLNENKDTEKDIEKYLHDAADWISQCKMGVTMIHAPEAGAFKKKTAYNDSRSGEGFAAALCVAFMVKYQGMTTQNALESIK